MDNAPDEIRHCLLIDGIPYCEVLELEISPSIHVPDATGQIKEVPQHRLILATPVHVDLLDARAFSVRFGGQHIGFEVYEGSEDGLSLLGCPKHH